MEIIEISDVIEYVNKNHDGIISSYTYEVDPMTGSLGWAKKSNPNTYIWATPNWGAKGETPFDINYSDGSYISYCVIDMVERTKQEQLKLYFTILVLAIQSIEDKLKSLKEEDLTFP
jgi:hypothetical protein